MRLVILTLAFMLTEAALANPVLDSVAAGQVAVQQSPNSTVVTQGSNQAIINWQSFNIGAAEKTHFEQPTGGVALNRISPAQGASQIYGQLSATGKIILVNQAGIFFGPGSRVDVGGIIASTSDISDANFLAGKYNFDKSSAYNGAIINQGTIHAAENGLVALVGTGVRNDGTIEAHAGNVVLASGNKFTVDLYGDQLINFTVDEAATSAGVDHQGNKLSDGVRNNGMVMADGGTIIVSAKAARGVVDNVVNMKGVAQARSVSEKNGVIILDGGDGNISVSGKIDVSGTTKYARGGKVKILAKNIHIEKTAMIDASGNAGGGEILIGGNYQGKGPEQNAYSTRVDNGAQINADAIESGNGGRVIVWADNDTAFYGSISARGGSVNGDGGFVETSGHYLDVTGISINLLSSTGHNGTWLLDPTDLTISTGATSNITTLGSTFTGDANSTTSILNITTLTTALNTANVIVQTTGGGTGLGSGDIIVGTPIGSDGNPLWTSSNTLELSAYRNIQLNNNITSSAAANIKLRADNTGTGIGTITGSGVITTTGGTANFYYNPAVFATPTDFSANVSGTILTAYMLINNATHLQQMNLNRNGNYALGTNIDLTGVGFAPIGTNGAPFTGSLDGQNYTITNLTILSSGPPLPQYSGLLGYAVDANVSNLGFITPSINTGNWYVGAIAGYFQNGSMQNTYVLGGSVSGFRFVGGLVGQFDNTTTSHLYNTSNVSANYQSVGGIAGAFSGILQDSYNQGTISAGDGLSGGLIGAGTGTILNSYNTGTVNGGFSTGYTGGLAGQYDGIIQNSYNQGIINGGEYYTGGLVGQGGGSILLSYNEGVINGGNHYTGGLVGQGSGSILLSYNKATVNGLLFETGGIIGRNDGVVQNSYNQGDVIVSNFLGFSIGGIAGSNFGNIQSSYNQGTITALTGIGIGGIVGDNSGLVQSTFNQGAIIGGDTVGGIVGSNNNAVQDSYNLASVAGGSNVGGVVASNNGDVISTYNAGYLSGSSSVGGIIGSNVAGGATSSYWDTQTSGQATTDGGGTPLMTSELQSTLPAGFSSGTWGVIPESYPYLLALYSSTPRVISGFVPGGSATAAGLSNSTVQIAANGVNLTTGALSIGNVTTGDNGYYYFIEPNNIIANNSALLAYLTSGVANAVTYAPDAGGSLTGLNMFSNTVSIGGDKTQTLNNTNALLSQAKGGLSSNILYDTSGTTNLILNPNISLVSSAAVTYELNGNMTASGTGNITFDGPVLITAGAIDVGAGNITLNNTLTLGSDSIFTSDGGNISLNGTVIGGLHSLALTGGAGGDHVFSLYEIASINALTINGNASVTNTIDFSRYVVPVIVNLLSPTIGNELNTGTMANNLSVNFGSFTQIQEAIGSNIGQSILILPNIADIAVTYTNPAHTSGYINDPFFFVNFIIQNKPVPAQPANAALILNPRALFEEFNNAIIKGTTSYIVNYNNMKITYDGVIEYYDIFKDSSVVNANINQLVVQQNITDQYPSTKFNFLPSVARLLPNQRGACCNLIDILQ